MSTLMSIGKWSTDSVESTHRLDYYADALSSAIVPAQLAITQSGEFAAHMDVLDLGGLTCIRQQGTAHRCFTDSRDVARGGGRYFHLILNRNNSWKSEHRGRLHLQKGDALFVDSQFVVDFDCPSDYDFLHLKFTEGWVKQWLPKPSAMAGVRIGGNQGWGKALTAFASALTPDFLESSPFPMSTMVDQLGSLLALSAQELTGSSFEPPKAQPPIERIRDAMWQMCCAPALTASDIAVAVGIPLRTFHRIFTRSNTTFGRTLTDMRCTKAVRMLQSPVCKRLTIGEIAFRSGFCDASHLSSVVRARTGRTPKQIRRESDTLNSTAEESEPC